MARNFLLSALILLFAALSAQAAGPPEIAGRVEFVIGDARFIDAWEQVRRPMQGDRLRASDTIVTGADGEVHLVQSGRVFSRRRYERHAEGGRREARNHVRVLPDVRLIVVIRELESVRLPVDAERGDEQRDARGGNPAVLG